MFTMNPRENIKRICHEQNNNHWPQSLRSRWESWLMQAQFLLEFLNIIVGRLRKSGLNRKAANIKMKEETISYAEILSSITSLSEREKERGTEVLFSIFNVERSMQPNYVSSNTSCFRHINILKINNWFIKRKSLSFLAEHSFLLWTRDIVHFLDADQHFILISLIGKGKLFRLFLYFYFKENPHIVIGNANIFL